MVSFASESNAIQVSSERVRGDRLASDLDPVKVAAEKKDTGAGAASPRKTPPRRPSVPESSPQTPPSVPASLGGDAMSPTAVAAGTVNPPPGMLNWAPILFPSAWNHPALLPAFYPAALRSLPG